MAKHPFRVAIERAIPTEDFAKLFAPDVVIYAPMLSKPVAGAKQVVNIASHAAKAVGPIRFTLEVKDAKQTILLWNGTVDGFTLEAVTILVDDENGLIKEMRVLMRSWPMVTLFRDTMYKELSSGIPADFWELQPKTALHLCR